jgi:hypothetical protein
MGQTMGFRFKGNRCFDRVADLRRIFAYENFTRLVGQKFGLFRHRRISFSDFYISRRELSASGIAQLRIIKKTEARTLVKGVQEEERKRKGEEEKNS